MIQSDTYICKQGISSLATQGHFLLILILHRSKSFTLSINSIIHIPIYRQISRKIDLQIKRETNKRQTEREELVS